MSSLAQALACPPFCLSYPTLISLRQRLLRRLHCFRMSMLVCYAFSFLILLSYSEMKTTCLRKEYVPIYPLPAFCFEPHNLHLSLSRSLSVDSTDLYTACKLAHCSVSSSVNGATATRTQLCRRVGSVRRSFDCSVPSNPPGAGPNHPSGHPALRALRHMVHRVGW